MVHEFGNQHGKRFVLHKEIANDPELCQRSYPLRHDHAVLSGAKVEGDIEWFSADTILVCPAIKNAPLVLGSIDVAIFVTVRISMDSSAEQGDKSR